MSEIGEVSFTKVNASIEWKITNISVLNHSYSPQFLFMNNTFSFETYLSKTYKDTLCVNFNRFGDLPETLTYTFYVKKPDGTLEKTNKHGQIMGIFVIDGFSKRKSELCPSDTMTLICQLQDKVLCVDPEQQAQQTSELIELESLRSDFGNLELESLSSDFGNLFENKIKCDVTLIVGDKEFEVHRTVLMARSKVLGAMFLHNTSELETGVVNIPDCDSDSFGIFLRYLYTARTDDISAKNASHLYVTADKYDMPKLKSFCVHMMARNLSLENICSVAALADLYEEADLMSSVQTFFNRNLAEIFRTDEWEKLLKEDLRLANKLLKRMTDTVKIVC